MGYKKPNTYALPVTGGNIDPLDSTTYYAGGTLGGLTTGEGSRRMYIPRAGFVRAVYIDFWANTVTGSSEDIVMSVRLNATTDYSVATVGAASIHRIFNNQKMMVPVSVGDFIELKIVTPAWVTNPTVVFIFGAIFFECE